VQQSPWRDKGYGVLADLGSHLLDTLLFWFENRDVDFRIVSANRFENKAFDHLVFASKESKPFIECELSLLAWRNHFTADVFGEKGSAHISSLCKWGPSSFTLRKRILPSGRPPEESQTLIQDDPTWAEEYNHFNYICSTGGRNRTNLANDRWIQEKLEKLYAEAEK
jgi:predicted dehydrogenase